MPLASYLGFVLASVLLILVPGPNVALLVGTSLRHGRGAGLVTLGGSLCAMVIQLIVTILGLAAAITAAAHILAALRWAGVAYLLVLGVRTLFAPADVLVPMSAPVDLRRAARRGFLVSLTNPKTLLFYGAFLPQFVDRSGDATRQLLLLATTFLVIAAGLDTGWVLLAHRARGLLALRPRWRNRISGTCLMGAAAGLALVQDKR